MNASSVRQRSISALMAGALALMLAVLGTLLFLAWYERAEAVERAEDGRVDVAGLVDRDRRQRRGPGYRPSGAAAASPAGARTAGHR